MEDFKQINRYNTLESLQEDPLFVIRFLADINENLEPFLKTFFGFNRLKIGALVNITLDTIDNLTGAADMYRRRRRCVDSNKKVLLLLFQSSLTNWQCINEHIEDFVKILKPLWKTLFRFTVLNDNECSVFNPVCLMFKTAQIAKLSAAVMKHSGTIMIYASDFILNFRRCQKNIKPFEIISQKILKNIRICTLI